MTDRRSSTENSVKTQFKPADDNAMVGGDWFMLRTPTLPFDTWLDWTSLADPVTGPDGATETADPAKSGKKLRNALRHIVTPQFLEAIYLTSSAMSASLADWLENPNSEATPAVEASLVAYFTRLASRPTPFGLFSSVSAGNVSAATDFLLSPDPSRHRTQIGLPFLRELYRETLKNPDVRAAIQYIPNPTIRLLDGNIHYLKRVEAPEGKTFFAAAMCRETSPLMGALASADAGLTIAEMIPHAIGAAANSVASVNGKLRSQALQFIERLIDSQILLPMVGPVIAGPDPAAQFIEQASRIDGIRTAGETVAAVSHILEQLNWRETGDPIAQYKSLAERLLPLRKTPQQPAPHLFFVDSYRTTPNLSLGKSVVNEILSSVRLLSTISAKNDSTWERFKEKFTDRFGSEEVPLTDLFEADFDFHFDEVPTATGERRFRETHLLRKVAETIGEQKAILNLSPADLAALQRPDPGKLPSSFAVLCTLLASSAAEIDAGNYQIFIDGISRAGSLLGRFAGLDEDWHNRVETLVRKEQQFSGDAVLADVIYDPPGKAGTNVLCRPVLTDYVIPFFGATSAPRSRQIRLSELTVSIRGGEVVLWSARLNKEVIPIHNTAYAFHTATNPPMLRFLCKLAMGTSSVSWDWGRVLESFPFLPRLQCGRLIIARAQWKVHNSELHGISGMKDPKLICRMRELRRVRHIPRFVMLLHEGRRLPVDLENILSLKMFLRLTRQQEEITLAELLPASEHLCVRNSQGQFQHELVLPVTSEPKISSRRQHRRHSPVPIEQRRMLPASDWMYIKVYARPSLLDTLLRDSFTKFMEARGRDESIAKWFFIRYTDPAHHLRIRFRLRQPGFEGAMFSELGRHLNPLQHQGLLWKWQVDTYEREIERYGGLPGMDAAENIFCADSIMAVKCLQQFPTIREREEARSVLCLLSIDEILNDFGLHLSNKLALMRELCNCVKSGIENHRQLEIRFGMEMRSERRNILMTAARLDALLAGRFHQRSAVLRPEAAILRHLDEQRALTQPVSSLIKDFIHLSINRLKTVTKKDEWKIYECLQRLYASCQGRELSHLRELYALRRAEDPSGKVAPQSQPELEFVL